MSPVLYGPTVFDPIESYTFTFSFQGPQVFGSRLIIEEITDVNSDGSDQLLTVWNHVERPSLRMSHELPANVLARNKRYQARLSVFDREGNESYPSPPVRFHCYGTPRFCLMYDGDMLELDNRGQEPRVKIENSTAVFRIYYSQTQDLALSSYRLDLYSAQKQLLAEGSPKYLGAYKGFGDLDYTAAPEVSVRGLEDNGRYFVQAVGETEYGMVIYSPMVELDVEYLSPPQFSIIEATNIEHDATIRVHSNLIVLEGWCSQNPPRYIDNQRIDLGSAGAYVKFDKGFTILGDFAIYLEMYNPIFYQEFFEIQNGDYKITLKLMRGWYDENMRERAYIMCRVYNNVTNYEIYSDMFDVPGYGDLVYVWLRRKGNYYELNGCMIPSEDDDNWRTRVFYAFFDNAIQWDRLVTEGYRNIEERRLEF